jgi:hypothetical protein
LEIKNNRYRRYMESAHVTWNSANPIWKFLLYGFLLSAGRLTTYREGWYDLQILYGYLYDISQSCGSSVSIAMCYGLDSQGIGVLFSVDMIFFSSIVSRLALGLTQFPIQRVLGVISSGIKRPGCQADHWLLPGTEVKNPWIYTSALPYVFMA